MKYLLVLAFFNVIWAGTLIAYKVLGDVLPVGVVVTIRFGLAGVIMAMLWKFFKGEMPKGINFAKAIIMGCIVFCLGHRFQVAGNKLGGAGNSAILMAFEPMLASVLAAIFLKELIPFRRWIGFVLGMCGVAVLNGVWREDFKWTGLGASLMFITSLLCETAYSIIGKPVVKQSDPGKVLCIALLSGTALNLCFDYKAVISTVNCLSLNHWLLFGYLSILCTVAGYWVWLGVLKKVDVNIVALTIFIQPIAGVPMAAIFLKENLHWGQLFGGIIIAIGLVLGFWKSNEPAA
ncbi:MAG TPA: DMT family transporter [Verrucomicrobiota bacterium]|nr:DMT family transporter [Verrucomicrobiota bacterium]